MAKQEKAEIPSFLATTTHDAEIGGRTLRFYPISAQVLFRLRPVAGPAAKVVDAVLSHQPYQERQKAIAELLEAVASNGELAATVILDALHEEPWVARPVTVQAASAFFAKVDGPTIVLLLRAVMRVNREALAPFFEGLQAEAEVEAASA